jgi:single-strand DNA-binding protein
MNLVVIDGHLGADPESRQVNDTTVTNLSVAVDDSYTRDGERVERTVWVQVEAWGRLAENCAEYLEKGREVLVRGELKKDSWETDGGEKRSKMKVRAAKVEFKGTREPAETQHNGQSETTGGGDGAFEPDDNLPF